MTTWRHKQFRKLATPPVKIWDIKDIGDFDEIMETRSINGYPPLNLMKVKRLDFIRLRSQARSHARMFIRNKKDPWHSFRIDGVLICPAYK